MRPLILAVGSTTLTATAEAAAALALAVAVRIAVALIFTSPAAVRVVLRAKASIVVVIVVVRVRRARLPRVQQFALHELRELLVQVLERRKDPARVLVKLGLVLHQLVLLLHQLRDRLFHLPHVRVQLCVRPRSSVCAARSPRS